MPRGADTYNQFLSFTLIYCKGYIVRRERSLSHEYEFHTEIRVLKRNLIRYLKIISFRFKSRFLRG